MWRIICVKRITDVEVIPPKFSCTSRWIFKNSSIFAAATTHQYLRCIVNLFLSFRFFGQFSSSCYIHNFLADISAGFLQVFIVELRSPHGTSNHISYKIKGRVPCSDSVTHNKDTSVRYSCILTRHQPGLNLQPPPEYHLEA